ncbi:hypothetical protein CA54_61520 [Symmachiella macrocystis]|uniref:Uncharacterized protein n=1 Tax=Symmachiella macrocystis TaxID=2527985 RepID=A0A5C6ATZ7_9PLAN|nr:hypothetical protein CA54_61520 [Symmachiella macrocystis]
MTQHVAEAGDIATKSPLSLDKRKRKPRGREFRYSGVQVAGARFGSVTAGLWGLRFTSLVSYGLGGGRGLRGGRDIAGVKDVVVPVHSLKSVEKVRVKVELDSEITPMSHRNRFCG